MKTRHKIALIAGIVVIGFLAISCRKGDEPEPPRIEKLNFEEKAKQTYVGDTATVKINAQPEEGKSHDRIEYRASDSSVIEIQTDSSNDGVVFKGLKRGTTVITASVNGVVDYCAVTVVGGDEAVIPHIVVSDYVLECLRGERRSIVASLAGGTPLDNSAFVWSYSGQDKNVISLESANNVGVFDTLSTGESVITVSHPKAQFSVNVLVFVTEKNIVPVYITTSHNVINLKTAGNLFEYAVNLYGSGGSGDNYGFMHEILDGNDVIGLRANNNIGTVTPKARGIARIGVSHQKAAHRIEIIVIVTEEIVYNYIDIDNTLLLMEEGHYKVINAVLEGNAPEDYIDKFVFSNENNDVIEIESSKNMAGIKALKRGSSVITVKNEYADFDREVLVIVNGPGEMVSNEYYITTNQNVITTEVNGEAELTMKLAGGNSADANNFIWTVEDGSIIEVNSAHGEVRYANRSMVNNGEQKFEAVAYIKAKKIGTTKITIENPKSKNDFSVIVKVYKQGVFGVVPVVIGGPSYYRIKEGETADAYLRVVTGLEKSLANMQWKSSNDSVFSVNNFAGLTGVLKAEKAGVATLTVSGDNVKYNYVATVIVGDTDYLNTQPYIYVSNPHMSIVKGTSAAFRIECENMNEEQIAGLSAVNNDPDKIEMFAYRNNVTVTGLELGEGKIVISGAGLNDIIVTVRVEEYDLNPDMPYYLRTEKFIYGVVKNKRIEVSVDLVGGIAVNEKNIIWEITDTNVANIVANGKKCLVDGKNEGQTVLKVKHAQSNNELEIVIYVVLNDADLNNKVIMHVNEQNILLSSGQVRYISIITNAGSAQQAGFIWNFTNPDVIGVTPSADKIKAYVLGKDSGNATISVKYGNQMPLVIYVSVVNSVIRDEYISVPSVVEMVIGQTVNINAVTRNIYDKYNIKWESKDEKIAKAYGNGDVCTVTAYKGERTFITVTYKDFVKDILLCVYGSMEEMGNAYLFAPEQSRYVINKGDIITIGLVFGLKGYPDYMQPNIRWAVEEGAKIDVQGNGRTASIKGLNAGIGVVNASDNYGNSANIEIVVQESGKAGKYSFSVREYGKTSGEDRIIGVLAGSYADLEVRVFNGTSEITNISGIEYELDNEEVLSIENQPFGIRVRAAEGKESAGYITLRHNSIDETRVMVYTALSAAGLNDAFPVLVEKTHYLMKKNENVTVYVVTKPDDGSRLRNISYDLEKDNGVIRVSERNKTEIVIAAEKTGSGVVLVRYNAETVQRVYVSVVEESFGSNAGYIITENIIGMAEGETCETRIDTNITSNIIWRSGDRFVCEVAEDNSRTAVLRGVSAGETEITVRSGEIERVIKVFVVKSAQELSVYEGINIEQRKYKIRKNESVNINIHSYQGKVNGVTEYGDYYRYSVPYGNVIAVNSSESGKISVRGVNEGTAAVRISNDYYKEEFVVYVEVHAESDGGNVSVAGNKHYITAEKTLYVIGEEEKNVYVPVDVAGEYFYGDGEWVWQGYDESVIEVNAMGRGAFVSALQRGRTKIQVFNPLCENNPFGITVIVGDRFEAENSKLPYIFVEKDLYEVIKNGGNLSIPYRIDNVETINSKNILFDVAGNNIEVRHDVSNGVFNVTPKETGIAKFVIKYGSLRREVYILVKENLGAGSVYLTTSENYIIASIGELRAINIQLVGYDELDSSKLAWSMPNGSPENVIQLSGNGATGEIYGVSEGDVVVNVRHLREGEHGAFNTLTINIKIVKDKSKERVVYLTTQKNVIEVVKGSQSEMIYVQKIGGDINISEMTWESLNPNIVTLNEIKGNGARILAHNEGEARITVSNTEARYVLEITVIVRQALNNNIYIASGDALLWLSPGERNKRISAVLVNGDVKYNKDFKWSVYTQSPSNINKDDINASAKVINIIPSNDVCVIDAVNEGVAVIRVDNIEGRAQLPLFITVYVSQFREAAFSTGRKELIIGEYDFVELLLPTYERLADKARVWVEDVNGNFSSLLDVYYTNSLVMLNGREEALGGREEGYAVVKAAVAGKEGYAQMLVHVVRKADPNVNRVVVGKNLYVVSPKPENIILNVSVTGPDIFDSDLDEIRWEVTQNKSLISLIPQSSGKLTDEEGNEHTYSASGRSVQLRVEDIKSTGTVVLNVMHKKVTSGYWKKIFIVIDDLGNYFNFTRTDDVEVNSSRPETVAVNIVGGTSSDYAEVKWAAKMQQKWDGTMIEIVRIMGSGREVTLYPLNNGETEVMAFYNGVARTIKVSVVSDYYLDFESSNEYMYPGETRDLPFDIKPASSNVNWIPSGALMGKDKDKNDIVIASHVEIIGSPVNGVIPKRFLRVTAVNEGAGMIVAMANGKIAQVNIISAFDYGYKIHGGVTHEPGIPKYTINNPALNISQSSDGVIEVSYWVYPANTYIEAVENTVPGGLTVEILKQENEKDSKGRTIGRGTIKFTSSVEMAAEVHFKQYKATLPGKDKEEVEGGEKTFSVFYNFPDRRIFPFFMRGDGEHSNTTNNTSMPVKGTAYPLMKNNAAVQNGEKITDNTLDLADGEVHHILFDKIFDNMNVDITSISISKDNAPIGNMNIPKDLSEERKSFVPADEQVGNFEFQAEVVKVDYNNVEQKAIRLSGGKDYIEYKRIGFTKKLYMYVQSKFSQNSARNYSHVLLENEASNPVEANIMLAQNGSSWSMAVKDTKNTVGDNEREYCIIEKSFFTDTGLVDDYGNSLYDTWLMMERFGERNSPLITPIATVPELQRYVERKYPNRAYPYTHIFHLDVFYDYQRSETSSPDYQNRTSDLIHRIQATVIRMAPVVTINKNMFYIYNWDVYNRNKAAINGAERTLKTNLYFASEAHISHGDAAGGYVITDIALDNEADTVDPVTNKYYGYDLEKLKNIIRRGESIYLDRSDSKKINLTIKAGFVEIKDENGNMNTVPTEYIDGWDYGYFCNMLYGDVGREGDSTSRIYSSREYSYKEIADVDSLVAEESRYDVFDGKFREVNGTEILKADLKKVYLEVPDIGLLRHDRYTPGALKMTNYSPGNCHVRHYEYIMYKNIYGNDKAPIRRTSNGSKNADSGNIFRISGDDDKDNIMYSPSAINNKIYGSRYYTGNYYSNHGYNNGNDNGYGCRESFYQDTWEKVTGWFITVGSGFTVPGFAFMGHKEHRHQAELYDTGVSAQQTLRWEDGQETTVPYYFFNCFPFRYETQNMGQDYWKDFKEKNRETHYVNYYPQRGEEGYNPNRSSYKDYPSKQIVKLDHVEDGTPVARPMPSLSRENVVSQRYTLTVNYNIKNIKNSTDPNDTQKIEFTLNCIVKPCHSGLTSTGHSDMFDNKTYSYTKNNVKELEGSVTSFNGNTIEAFKRYLEQ